MSLSPVARRPSTAGSPAAGPPVRGRVAATAAPVVGVVTPAAPLVAGLVAAATVLLVAASALLLAGLHTAAASADVLRLDPLPGRSSEPARGDAGPRAAATVVAPDGSRRRLPDLDAPGVAYAEAADLSPSPDGGVVALTTSGAGAIYADRRIALVPTDGGPRRILRVDGRAWLKVQGEPVWSPDGRELVLGGVRPVLPSRGGHRRLGAFRVVRCAADTGRCRNVPGSGSRVAGPLPDGRIVGVPVTWPSREVRTPCGWRLFLVEGSGGSPFRPGGRCDRFLDGTAVASSAGVLIEREAVDLRRTGPSDAPGLRSSVPQARAVAVSATGVARTVPAPHLTTAAGVRRRVRPTYPLPDGSWLGSVGGQNGGRQAEVLTVTTLAGRTRAVRVGTTDATPYAVARAAGTALPRDDVQMSLAGYERSTDSAVVVVSALTRATAVRRSAGAPGRAAAPGVCTLEDGCPAPPRPQPDGPPPGALVRVPLHGGHPTAIEPVTDGDAVSYAAW